MTTTSIELVPHVPPAPDTVRTLIMKGGGVKGLAFAGAVEVLTNSGYQFDTYVGTSAGAVGAVMLAAGYSPQELREVLGETQFKKFMDANFLHALWNLVAFGGLYPGNRLDEWVEDVLQQKFAADKFPEVKMNSFGAFGNRAIVFASHPRIGTLTFDSSGENSDYKVSYAVRLSASIPGFFVPGSYAGKRVYDGGLLNNFPIEVYQRIRRTGTPAEQSGEDFIALYIGSTERPKQRWWFMEAIEIMLFRDDTIMLQKHHSRSLILDTRPVSTTDFHLHDKEKELLVEIGREAAHRFVGNIKAADELRGKVNDLRWTVTKIRRRRFGFRILRLVMFLVLFVAIGVGIFHANQIANPRQYAIVPTPLYRDTYVDHEHAIGRLHDGPVAELKSTYSDYPPGFTNGYCRFDSVVQVVLNDSQGAIKLVVSDCTFDGKATRLKATASAFDGVPTADAYVFQRDGEAWKSPVWWKSTPMVDASPSSTGKSKVVKTANLEQNLRVGARFRFVVIATYSNVFQYKTADDQYEPVNTIPWILYAHRYLKPQGEATYVMLGDPPDEVRFPSHVYVKYRQNEFQLVSPPLMSINSVKAWNRLADHLDFLQDESVTAGISAGLRDDLSRVLTAVNNARRDALEQGLVKRNLVFTFDAKEVAELDQPHEDLNLVVFAERSE